MQGAERSKHEMRQCVTPCSSAPTAFINHQSRGASVATRTMQCRCSGPWQESRSGGGLSQCTCRSWGPRCTRPTCPTKPLEAPKHGHALARSQWASSSTTTTTGATHTSEESSKAGARTIAHEEDGQRRRDHHVETQRHRHAPHARHTRTRKCTDTWSTRRIRPRPGAPRRAACLAAERPAFLRPWGKGSRKHEQRYRGVEAIAPCAHTSGQGPGRPHKGMGQNVPHVASSREVYTVAPVSAMIDGTSRARRTRCRLKSTASVPRKPPGGPRRPGVPTTRCRNRTSLLACRHSILAPP